MSQCHDVYDDTEGMPHPPCSEATGGERSAQCPAHNCQIMSDRRGKVLIVWVAGTLDWATTKHFSALMTTHHDVRALIVDLSEARLDAAGSGALVTAVERAHERRQQVVLVVTNPMLRGVLTTIGLNLVVPIVGSEPDAIDWLEGHGIPTGPPQPTTDRAPLVRS